jgi:transposase
MGVCRAVFDLDERRGTAARAFFARSFQRFRWIVRTGAPWRWLPNDLPPWEAVYQQSQRWIKTGVFEAVVSDLREILRITAGKKAKPSAGIFDSRTLQLSPGSGERAEYDGAKRRKGSKTSIAVDTLGNLLALLLTPADEQDRAQVSELAEKVQKGHYKTEGK